MNYPLSISLGDSATIDLTGMNTGSDQADEGYLQISFPSNPGSGSLSLISDDFDMGMASPHWAGELVNGCYLTCTVTLSYSMVEGADNPWPAGTSHSLQVRVTPSIAGAFTFYVKLNMRNSAGTFAHDPVSGTMDQQSEYVKVYTFNVVPPAPAKKIWVLMVGASIFSSSALNSLDAFNNDVWRMYGVLTNVYGIPRNQMRIYVSQYETTTPTTVDGEPTKSNVNQGLTWLGQVSTVNDLVFIMLLNHGGTGAVIYLSDGVTDETMTGSELGTGVRPIPHDKIVIILGHCYSGAFVQYLSASNHIVMTSVDASHQSIGTEYDVDDDGIFFPEPSDTVAFFSFPEILVTALSSHDADADGNGEVSFGEAYDYVVAHDGVDITPLLDDNGDGLANQTDGILAAQVSLGSLPVTGDPSRRPKAVLGPI